MKRSIEMLGILFVFALFCPSSAEAIISGNDYAYEDGEGYAYEWKGEPEDISPKYSYEYDYKNGEANGYDVSNVDSLDEITQMEFSHTFANRGLERGPFELMNMERFHRPGDTPVENCWDQGNDSHPVPEPGTMLLMALGGSLLFSRRKR